MSIHFHKNCLLSSWFYQLYDYTQIILFFLSSMTTPEKKTTSRKPKTGVKKTPVKSSTPKKINAQKAVTESEKVVDNAVHQVKQKMEKHIDPSIREKATKIAWEAESVATSVENFWETIGSVADSILPSWKGTTWTFNASFEKHVSRLFIFRCLRLIIQWPIVFIWSIWYCIISIVHYISMFLTWTRNQTMRNKQTRYRRHVIAWKAYMNAITDKRPDILVD